MEKLTYFHKIHKIPHIIFHGPSGTGKRTIVSNFINIIYNNDKEKIKSFAMYVNCAHGKGIKFIREELKFFAKTHIHSNGGDIFKSIILLNADKLTTDAQSALRRCIELFSHNTRFFIIVEDKYKLLKPILSRFCEIYIPEPVYHGNPINLYKYNLNETFKMKSVKVQRIEWLKKELEKNFVNVSIDCHKEIENKEKENENENKNKNKNKDKEKYNELIAISTKLYEKGYSSLDIIQILENDNKLLQISNDKRYELIFAFHKVKREFRNEKLLIMFILNFLFLDTEFSLENISFI